MVEYIQHAIQTHNSKERWGAFPEPLTQLPRNLLCFASCHIHEVYLHVCVTAEIDGMMPHSVLMSLQQKGQ